MCDAQHIGSIDGTEPERAYQDIPPSVARLVWRRDGGRCRVPGCRSSRGLELHHLIHRADGGTHEASNLGLVCAACHQAHHDGRLTISGTVDQIEVHRRGAHVDATESVTAAARPGAHVDATDAAMLAAHPGIRVDATAATPAACSGAHVDTSQIVTPAARPGAHVDARPGARVDARSKLDGAIVRTQAKAALIGLGWKPTIAHAAVAAAVAAQGTEVVLERLIVEALRRCPVPRA